MSVLFTCQCGNLLRTSDAFVGRSARCPTCGRLVRVNAPGGDPTADAAGATPPSAEPPPAPVALSPEQRLRRLMVVTGVLATAVALVLGGILVLRGTTSAETRPTGSIGRPPGPPQMIGVPMAGSLAGVGRAPPPPAPPPGALEVARPPGSTRPPAAGTGPAGIPLPADVSRPPLRGHDTGVAAVAFTDGTHALSAGWDGSVRRWDLAAGKSDLAFGPRSPGHRDRCTALFAFANHGPIPALVAWQLAPDDGQKVASAAFSPDGQWIAFGGYDRRVHIRDVKTGQERWTLGGHLGTVSALAWAPDGKRLLVAGTAGTLVLWEFALGGQVGRLHADGPPITCVAFSPDGRRAAAGRADGQVLLCDVTGETVLRSIKGIADTVHGVAFIPPDGRDFVLGNSDGTVLRWNTEAKDPGVSRYLGHEGDVWCVAVSPDGNVVLSGGADATVRVWNKASGYEVRLAGHVGAVRCVAVSPDGDQVLSGGDDQTVRLWDTPVP